MNLENLRAGWVSVYRSIQDHHLWTQHPAEYLKIWLYFLVKASRKPRSWWDGEREISIPIGGFVGSLNTISDNCRVSRKQAERAVNIFKKCSMIDAKPGQRYTLYVVVNFTSYQSGEDQMGTPRGREGDTEGTQGGHERDTEGTLRGLNNRKQVIGNRCAVSEQPTAAAGPIPPQPSLAPLTADEWAAPDPGQEARLLVGELLKAHPNPGNRERAVWAIERVLAESLDIPRIMASIRTSHAAWCVLWQAEPKRFKPLLSKWVEDGDYMTVPAPPAKKELEW